MQFAPAADPENPGARQLNGNVQVMAGRRVLGDIGNLGNAQPGKVQGGKDGVSGRTGVLTRRAAAQLAAVTVPTNNTQGTDSWGTRPRASLRPRDGAIPVVSAAPQDYQPYAHVPPSTPNIDAVDKKDPLAAVDFISDMMKFYEATEPKVRVASDYMDRQSDINDKMRAILIDWLVDVHIKFKLMPETLYLTVNLIDRFLEVKQVTRKHLQLVGVTAMLVASKYEEIWAPEVRDFVYISDRAYNRDQILNMEKIMLNVLRFNLTVPTPFHFFQRFIKAAGISLTEDPEIVAYASYLLELALPDYSMLKFSYSQIAAAAVCGANAAFGRDPLPRALVRHSGYTETELSDCVASLGDLYGRAPRASLNAVYKKFSSEKFHNVANREAPPRLDARMDV